MKVNTNAVSDLRERGVLGKAGVLEGRVEPSLTGAQERCGGQILGPNTERRGALEKEKRGNMYKGKARVEQLIKEHFLSSRKI